MHRSDFPAGRIVRPFVLLVAAMVTTGCVILTAGTKYALYDPKTQTRFDPRLTGTWMPEYYLLSLKRGEGNAYQAGGLYAFMVPGASDFDKPHYAYLVPLGKYEYLFPASEPGQGTSLDGCCRVKQEKDKLVLQMLNIRAIADDLDKHPGALKHVWIESDGLVTTAPSSTQPAPIRVAQATTSATLPAATQNSTAPTTAPAADLAGRRHLELTDDPKAIRDYLVMHQDDPGMFSEPFVLRKISP